MAPADLQVTALLIFSETTLIIWLPDFLQNFPDRRRRWHFYARSSQWRPKHSVGPGSRGKLVLLIRMFSVLIVVLMQANLDIRKCPFCALLIWR